MVSIDLKMDKILPLTVGLKLLLSNVYDLCTVCGYFKYPRYFPLAKKFNFVGDELRISLEVTVCGHSRSEERFI